MRVVSFLRFPGLNWAKGDPGHQIPAEHGLRVQARYRRQLLARFQLEQRGDDRRGADVDGQTELHQAGVAALDGQDPAGEGRHRHGPLVVPQRLGECGEDAGSHVAGREPHRGHELLDVGGLVVLLSRQGDLHDLLGHARFDRDVGGPGRAGAGAQDLEGFLLDRRRQHHRGRLLEPALAGQAITLAHEVVAELQLIGDGGWRHRAGDEFDAARGAAAPAATGGGDLDAGGVSGFEDARAGRRLGPTRRRIRGIDEDGQRDGHGSRL